MSGDGIAGGVAAVVTHELPSVGQHSRPFLSSFPGSVAAVSPLTSDAQHLSSAITILGQVGAGVIDICAVLFSALIVIFFFIRFAGDGVAYAAKPFYSITMWVTATGWNFAQQKILDDPNREDRMKWFIAAILIEIVLLIVRTLAVVFRGVMVLGWHALLITGTFALAALFLTLEQNAQTLTSVVVRSGNIASTGASNVLGVVNTVTLASNAIQPAVVVTWGNAIQWYSGAYAVMQSTLSSGSASAVTPDTGRRVLQSSSSSVGAGLEISATIDEVASSVLLLAAFLDAYYGYTTALYLVWLSIALLGLAALQSWASTVALYGGCGMSSPDCALRELAGFFLDLAATYYAVMQARSALLSSSKSLITRLNPIGLLTTAISIGTAIAFNGGLSALTGTTSPVHIAGIACGSQDFTSTTTPVTCMCSSNSNPAGPFSGQTACNGATVSCSQDSELNYLEVMVVGATSAVTGSGSDPSTACGTTRRLLTSVGALAALESLGAGVGPCFSVCTVNSTLWDVCAPTSPDSHLTWTLQGPCPGTTLHDRSLAQAPPPPRLPRTNTDARRMLASTYDVDTEKLRVAVKRAKSTSAQAQAAAAGAPSPTAKPTRAQKEKTMSVEELERKSAKLVDDIVLSVGKFAFACRDLGVTHEVEKPHWMRTALSVTCTLAAVAHAGTEGLPAGPTEEDAHQKFAEMAVAQFSGWRARVAPPESKSGRRLQSDADGEEHPLWAQVLTLVRTRTALWREVWADSRLTTAQKVELSAMSTPLTQTATRRMLGSTIATHPAILKMLDRPARYTRAATHAAKHLVKLAEHLNARRESLAARGPKRRAQRRLQQATGGSASPTMTPTTPTPVCPWGKLCMPTVCGGDTTQCPGFADGSMCVADESTCPYPAGATWGPWLEWQLIQGQTYVENINEVAYIENDIIACYQAIQANPALDPVGASDPNDPNLLYCPPLPRPTSTIPYQTVDVTVEETLNVACSGNGCVWSWYYSGLGDINVFTLAGIVLAVSVIAWNGFASFWTFITQLLFVNGPFLPFNLGWQSFWGAFVRSDSPFVLWFDNQGQPGTSSQILTGAVFHIGYLFGLIWLIIVGWLLWVIAARYAIAVVGNWIWLADYGFSILYEQVAWTILTVRYNAGRDPRLREASAALLQSGREVRESIASAQKRRIAKEARAEATRVFSRLLVANQGAQKSLRRFADHSAGPASVMDALNLGGMPQFGKAAPPATDVVQV